MALDPISGESSWVNRSDKVDKGQAFLQSPVSKDVRMGAVKTLVGDAKMAQETVKMRMQRFSQWYGEPSTVNQTGLIKGGMVTVTGLQAVLAGITSTETEGTALPTGVILGTGVLTASARAGETLFEVVGITLNRCQEP